jgi:hypothetical protein
MDPQFSAYLPTRSVLYGLVTRNAADGWKAGEPAYSDGCRGRDCRSADSRRLLEMVGNLDVLAAPQPKGHDRSMDG